MKARLVISAAFLSLCHVVYGQAAPAGVASESYFTSSLVPTLTSTYGDGEVHYSLGAAEVIQHGLYSGGDTNSTTSLSGSVGFAGNNERLPFSMLYSGGLLLTNFSGANVQTYQNATVSQGFVITPRMSFSVSDSVSYLPQSPTTGYSGIAGVGDLGAPQGPAQGPAGGILTYYGKRVTNSLNGGLERKLTASTSVSGSAGWDILRFVDGVGVDTTSIYGSAALNHRLDARTTLSGNVTYSIFTYGNYGLLADPLGLSNLSIQTRGANIVISRLLSHSLTLSASGGPQLINSSNSTFAPPRTTGAGSLSLTYVHKITTASISYSRGASGGSGVQQGSLTDTVSGSVSRAYGHDWQASITGNYTHSEALITNPLVNRYLGVNGTYNTVFAGVQVSHRLGVHTSMYGSYTVQQQSGSNAGFGTVLSPNVFNGVANIFSVGITWTPQSTRIGQF